MQEMQEDKFSRAYTKIIASPWIKDLRASDCTEIVQIG